MAYHERSLSKVATVISAAINHVYFSLTKGTVLLVETNLHPWIQSLSHNPLATCPQLILYPSWLS